MKRSNFFTIPDKDELRKILKTEKIREIPKENINLHFPDFSKINNLLIKLGIKTDIFEKEIFIDEFLDNDYSIVYNNL